MQHVLGLSMAEGGEESDCNLDLAEVPSPKRAKANESCNSRKNKGAALYQSSFQASWHARWPCVVPVKGNPHSFRCTLCSKVVSCAHQGERDVTRHIASAQHQQNAKALKGTAPLKFASQAQQVGDKVNCLMILDQWIPWSCMSSYHFTTT